MATIQNLEAETVRKLENDQAPSRLADIDRWIRDSLVEISGNPDYRDSFPELEVWGPTYTLTGGTVYTSVAEYPEAAIVPPGDNLIKTLDIMLWIDPPYNIRRKKLNPSHYQETDKFQSFPSMPVDWYRFGNNIGFDPTPDKNYQVIARMQRRHPITDYWNQQNQLNQTVILLPPEWYEVLEWAAALRGYPELLNYERSMQIRQLLWGDPDHPNNNPGLIASVKTKRRSEAWMTQQPLRPIIKSSCWGNP